MIEVYTDGASSGDPGPSGIGIIIKQGKERYEYAFSIGELSNHEAEFHAVIKALEICQKKFPGEILSFRTDSRVVADTIEKNFTNNKSFLPLLLEIRKKKENFPLFFIKWIPGKRNVAADRLARRAIHHKT